MQAIKSGFSYLRLCWQKFVAKYRQFIMACKEEPDFVDVIIFNDLALKCYEKHNNVNCPRKFCESCRVNRLISYINNAQVCMDIAHLVITNGTIFRAVLAAWNRGVNVRIVTDPEMLNVRGSQMRKLCSCFIPIHVATKRTIMHHKFCIIDGEQRILQLPTEERDKAARLKQRRGIVMTGSLNWTIQGTHKNYENVVITSNRKVNALYQQIFDNLYNNCGELTIVFNEVERDGRETVPHLSLTNYF